MTGHWVRAEIPGPGTAMVPLVHRDEPTSWEKSFFAVEVMWRAGPRHTDTTVPFI